MYVIVVTFNLTLIKITISYVSYVKSYNIHCNSYVFQRNTLKLFTRLQIQDGINLRMSFIVDLLDQLIIHEEQQVVTGGAFDGMTFCVTGTLSESRKSIQARIKSAGGKVVSSVSGNLSILVAGENAGSKLAKAEKLNITVWNEEKLLNQLSVAGNDQADESESSQPTLFDY